MLISALSNQACKVNINISMKTYKNPILFTTEYGAIISGIATNSIINSLNSINNQSIRLSIGAFNTSLIPSILCEAKTPPLG